MAEQPRRGLDPDTALPPVQPPSAAFLVQLFVVPLTIVACGLFVVWGFYWLAQLGNDPEGYVRALRRDNEGRWQVALNFANDLRGPGGAKLKTDAGLASELAGILADEVASGRPRAAGRGGDQARALCGYLCRALGEFSVPEAAPPLIERAADASDPQTAQAAVEALAVLADNLASAGAAFADPAAVAAATLAASRSDDMVLRSRAAYALGVLGGDVALARLGELLDDPDDNVRCNAAVGLARQGRVDGMGQLAEMLAREDVAVPPGDEEAQARRYKRAMVVRNALKATAKYVDATGLAPPAEVVERLVALDGDPVAEVRTDAAALSRRIGRLGVGEPSTP